MENISVADIRDAEWHYELEGTRQGPVSETRILAMIADKSCTAPPTSGKKAWPTGPR